MASPQPPPVPPGGPGGGDDAAARIGGGIKTLLDEANQKLSPADLKTLVHQMKAHAIFKHKL